MISKELILRALWIFVLIVLLIIVSACSGNSEQSFSASSFEKVVSEATIEGPDCPADVVYVEGSGESDLLGEFSVVRRHCFTMPDHPDFKGEVIHDGVYEFTGSNGDKIWGTYTGEMTFTEFGNTGPVRGTLSGQSTIEGGSGQFENAKGEFTDTADYDVLADEGEFVFEGTISY